MPRVLTGPFDSTPCVPRRYCPVSPKNVCVHYTASEMYEDCQLDFDSDDEFGDTGKSLKTIWAETLDIWYTNVETIFTEPFMSTSHKRR